MPRPGRRAQSSRVPPRGRMDDGENDDPDVEEERPVVDVVDVVYDATFDRGARRGLAAEAMDLRPACNPRLDALAMGIDGELLAQLLVVRDGVWAGADEAHLAAQHVDELRPLVDRGGADEAADAGHARVVLLRLRHGKTALGHSLGAELPDHEGLAVEAAARLLEDHRAARLEHDQQRDDGQ